MIRCEVTVVAGRIDDPLIGYQKIVMVAPDPAETEDASMVMDVSKALQEALAEAAKSVTAQASYLAGQADPS